MTSKLNQTIDEMYKKSEKEVESVFDAVNKNPDINTKDISIVKNRASIFTKAAKRLAGFYHEHTADFKYLLLIIPILATFFIIKEVQRQQSLRTKAAIHQASIYFQVSSWALPPESSFDVWVNTDSQTSFVDAEITFDPNVVKLTGEITTYPTLGRVIKVTSMNDANSSGKVSIVLGLDPSQIPNTPSGTFRIATIKLNANTLSSLSTKVNFDNTKSQLVASDQTQFTTSVTGLTLNLNPTPTPTPIVSPTPTVTPTPGPPTAPPQTTTPKPTPTPTPASGALIITNVQTTNITDTSAVVGWNLSDYGTGQVEYGKTNSYGLLSKAETSFNWNYHIQTLSGLSPNTLYHYRVFSSNKAGVKTTSDDHTFTTLASMTSPTPTPATKYVVSGVVTSYNSSEPIYKAYVKFRAIGSKWWQSGVTVQTNAYGHYEVTLSPKDYNVTVTKRGFKTLTKVLLLRTDTILNLQLIRR